MVTCPEQFAGEWVNMKLSAFAQINPSSVLPENFKYVDLESVKGISLLNWRVERKETAPSRAQRLAQQGDIFFQTVRPYQRNNYLFELPHEDFVFSTGYAQIRTKNDARFLFHLLRQDGFVNEVLDNCTGTSYPAINPTKLGKIELFISTDTAEQQAIASTLSDFDEHINNLTELIEKKKAIRNGALVDLASGKTRLDGFDDEWEESLLQELCDVYDGTHQTPQYTTNGIKFVSVENISDIYGSDKYISLSDFNRDFKYSPQKNDILMTRIGDVGTPCIVKTNEVIAYYVSLALFKNIKIDSSFLNHYIKGIDFQKELDDRTLHYAVPKKINKGEIGKCSICYPVSTQEQQAIAQILTTIDEEIESLETENAKMMQIREGAMDDLLTGRVRLKVQGGQTNVC